MFYAVVISDAESDTESDADADSDSDTESDDNSSEWPDPDWTGTELDGVCCVCNYEFVNGPFKGTVHDDLCSLYCFGLMQNHQ